MTIFADARGHLRRYEDPAFRARYMLHNAKQRARAAGAVFSLTREWITLRLRAGICEVTGLGFIFKSGTGTGHGSPWAPSIDRIDPAMGYTPENCRVVVWIFNCAKNVGTDEDVHVLASALCRKLSATNR
jgi:hypothetical protein